MHIWLEYHSQNGQLSPLFFATGKNKPVQEILMAMAKKICPTSPTMADNLALASYQSEPTLIIARCV